MRSQKSRKLKFILVALIGAALAYGVLCVHLPKSASLRVQLSKLPSALSDSRFSGLDSSGATAREFSFSEPRVMSRGAAVEIFAFMEGPALPSGEKVNFRLFGSESQQAFTKDGTRISLNDSLHLSEPIQFSASIPEQSAKGPSEATRLRVLALRIKPIGSLLFPVFSAALPLLVGVFILTLSILILISSDSRAVLISVPAAVQLLLLAMIRKAPIEHWEPAGWLLGVVSVVCLGLKLGSMLYRNSRRDGAREGHSSELALLMLAVLLIFGLWVRYQGIFFGQPLLYHPDEARKIQVAERILRSSDWNPGYFRHPNMLVYGMAIFSKAYSLAASVPIERMLVSSSGRILSLLAGIASCVLVFLIGRRVYGWFAGLIALGLAAASPLLVVTSRYTKEDSLLLFFTLLTALFAIRALDSRSSKRDLLLSAFFAGLSASAKYSGLVNILLPGFVLLSWAMDSFLGKFRHGRPDIVSGILPLGFLCLALFALGFLIITPYALITPDSFLSDFNAERVHMERGHSGAISAGAFFWMYHVHYSLLPALFGPGLVLALIGAGVALYRRRPEDLLILACLLIFYLPAEWVKAKPEPQPERYVIPCVAFLALLAGGAAAETPAFLSRAGLKGMLRPLIFLVVVLPPAVFSVGHALAMRKDTRTEAEEWINANIPAGSQILIDWSYYSPHLSRGKYHVRELKVGRGTIIQGRLSPQWLKANGVQYLVLSELYYRRYFKPANRFHPLSWRFRAYMSAQKPIKEFSKAPYDYGFHNPDIKIYAVE